MTLMPRALVGPTWRGGQIAVHRLRPGRGARADALRAPARHAMLERPRCLPEARDQRESPMMHGSTTVLTVSDIAASLAYYRDKLGFDIAFEYGNPTSYAGVCSGKVTLHLISASRTPRQPGHGAVAHRCRRRRCAACRSGEARRQGAQGAGEPRLRPARLSMWPISTATCSSSGWKPRRTED